MDYVIYNNPDLKYRYLVYPNGTIFNESTNKYIKPTNDPRRPTEPPIVYFKKLNDTRLFRYYDDFMAEMFLPGYTYGCKIHHNNGDISDCSLSNLTIANGLNALKEIFNDNRNWKKINPESIKDILNGRSLYFDYYICDDGSLFNGSTCSYIKPFVDTRDRNHGYKRYSLYTSKHVNDIIHVGAARLVAWHFLPHIDGKNIVLYKDNDPSNIDVSNLYYGDNWDSLTKHISNDTIKNRELTSLHLFPLNKEKWEPLSYNDIEFVDDYLISDYGRIYNKTKKFYVVQSEYGYPNCVGQKYMNVSLLVHDGNISKYKTFDVHRLVGYTFCVNKNPLIYTDINHINGNPSCNLAFNLEWVTEAENTRHAIETNLIHTSKFNSRVDDLNWRSNTLVAWTYTSCDKDVNKGYELYMYYYDRYNDNINKLTIDEYREYVSSQDKDFNNVLNFYQSNYLNK